MTDLMNHRAAKSPCVHCPWRIENHGKPHPSGWYTKKNLRRLWAGMRAGERMSCHPTDASNPVTEADQKAGYKPAPEDAKMRECAGSVILQQREVQRFGDIVDADPGGNAIRTYRQMWPKGLTREGLMAVVSRATMTWPGEIPMRRDHDLNEPVATADPSLEWEARK